MSNSSSSISDVSADSSNKLPAFPSSREREDFPYWLFKAEAFLMAKGLLSYIKSPVYGITNGRDDEEFEADSAIKYLGNSSDIKQLKIHQSNAGKAYNYIVQTLHPKQIELINNVTPGNAYIVMTKLKSTYGLTRTSNTHGTLLITLTENRKIITETITDYIARTERLISDLKQQDQHEMAPSMKKHFILYGIRDDNKWKHIARLVRQIDVHGSWSFDDLKQYLINEENNTTPIHISSSSTSSSTSSSSTPQHVTIPEDNHTKAYASLSSSHALSRGSYRGRGRGRSFHHRGRGGHVYHQSHISVSSSRGRGSIMKNDNYRNNNRSKCFNCNGFGHLALNCPTQRSTTPRCFTCGRPGHISSSCLQNKRTYNNNNHNNNNENNDNHISPYAKRGRHHSAYVVITSLSLPSSHALHINAHNMNSSDWILDGGASDHCISDINMLTDVYTLDFPRYILTANGHSTCTISGNVTITITPDHTVTLHDVLYVPDFQVNLLSVYRIVCTGAYVIYKQDAAYIMVKDKVDITVPRYNNMYILRGTHSSSSSYGTKLLSLPSSSSSLTINSSSSPTTSSDIIPSPVIPSSNINQHITEELKKMHYKYGHVNYQRLIKMINKNSIKHSMKIRIVGENALLKKLTSDPCEGCLRGKMTRSPMTGRIDYSVNGIMDMWVFDTMIFTIKTLNGNMYVTLNIDISSTEIYGGIHASKEDITDHNIKLIKMMQLQTGKILKRYHSDNGTEVVNKKMDDFLASQGTIHTTSTPYTPQHNSIVERKNRTVIDMSSSNMHHAKAYLPLYGEAIMCSIYILNRTTNTRTEFMTPIQHRTHHIPDISHFHVWGCDVTYHIHKTHRDHKFAAKSKPGIFVGYDINNERYYRILELEKVSVIITRDVTFYDDTFNNMKTLKAIMKNTDESDSHEEHDIDTMIISKYKNDYIPDEYLTEEKIAGMFGDEGRSVIPNNEDINNEDINNEDHMNEDKNEENKIEENINEDINEVNDDRTIRQKTGNNTYNTNTMEKKNRYSDGNINARQRRSSRITSQPFRFNTLDYATAAIDEPITYKQAVESDDSNKWLYAINEELGAHYKNKTWCVVERQNDMNVIGSKWVFKKKRDMSGNVSKYKARLVAKGFNQQYGIDYHDTFAPVMKYKSLRIMLALSLYQNTCMEQLDVKTAFLNAQVEEDIYIDIPEGMNVDTSHVLKLNRALYGIKQAPREWHKEIHNMLMTLEYTSCRKDPCIYWKKTKNDNIIIIGLFVDDIVSSYNIHDNNEWVNDKKKLMTKYEMTDMGNIHHILGMKIIRDDSYIMITQDVYINDKLKEFRYDAAKTVTAPETTSHTSSSSHTSMPLNIRDIHLYRQMVGSLMYAACSTRPDITHATNMTARYMSNPSEENMIMVQRIFRYLNGAKHHGLLYTIPNKHQGGELELCGYSDADWGGDLTDRKSTTGYCTMLNGNLISWQSKKQTTVALSSTEAEYMAICDITKEIMWIKMILEELNFKVITPIIIYVDNQSSIKISENDISHERTKHIDIKHYFVKDAIQQKIIQLKWISTHQQLADIFTKSLPSPTFTSLRDKLITHPNNHPNNN
jgi:transposase InsO family protein